MSEGRQIALDHKRALKYVEDQLWFIYCRELEGCNIGQWLCDLYANIEFTRKALEEPDLYHSKEKL